MGRREPVFLLPPQWREYAGPRERWDGGAIVTIIVEVIVAMGLVVDLKQDFIGKMSCQVELRPTSSRVSSQRRTFARYVW